MDLRIFLATLALAAAAATAQEKPVGSVPPQETKQEPEQAPPPRERTSADIIEELEREKERLLREIDYARARAANANRMLAEKLSQRGQTFESIDAGVNRPAPSPTTFGVKAQVMTDEQAAGLDADVMLTVDSLPIRQGEYDTLMSYLRGLPNSGTDEIRAQRVMFELIRIKAVEAVFPENAAEGHVSDVYAQLEQGKKMSELAAELGTVIGAQPDGRIEVTRNSFLGTRFEQIAFALEKGQRSRPFRNAFGFVVFECDEVTKGADPTLDKVSGYAVQVKYMGDQEQLNMAQARASRGQVEILVRDPATIDLLPAIYRPVNALNPTAQTETLQQKLQRVEARIEELRTAAPLSPDAAAELATLEKQRAQLKAAIEAAPPSDDTQAGDGGKSGLPVVPVEKKKGSDAERQPPKKN